MNTADNDNQEYDSDDSVRIQDPDEILIEKHYPFVKVIDEDKPEDYQMRLKNKTKPEFENKDKYKRASKKPLNFN